MVTSYYSCTFRFLALPRYCSDVCGGNGVYQIFPNTSDTKGFDVWCDIGSDGNIWTVRIVLQIIWFTWKFSFYLTAIILYTLLCYILIVSHDSWLYCLSMWTKNRMVGVFPSNYPTVQSNVTFMSSNVCHVKLLSMQSSMIMSVNYGWMVDINNASRHDISDNYMGTNCVPLLTHFSLYLYLIKASQEKRSFICTFRYIDDVLSLNNSKFGDFCCIYLSAWNNDTTKTTKSASYLNFHLEIDSEDQVRTKAYDERDDIYI